MSEYMGIKVRFSKGIVYVTASDQYTLCDMFMRLQEFYESPIESIRGTYFTEESFRDAYAKQFKAFDYHTAWGGFNVPGNIVKKFYRLFADRELSIKEKYLKEKLQKYCRSKKKFYVIGIIESESEGTTEHELAHAKYYLNWKYKSRQDGVIDSMPESLREYFTEALVQMKYDKAVAYDEIQAYLGTTLDFIYLTKTFKVKEMFWIKNKLMHLRTLPYLFKLRRNYKDSK